MLGILICLIMFIVGVCCIINGCLARWDGGNYIFWGIILCIIVLIILCGSFYINRIDRLEAYIGYRDAIAKIESTIDKNQLLNMKDNQIGVKLAEIIVDFECLKKEIRCAKKSPFTIFRPIIQVD